MVAGPRNVERDAARPLDQVVGRLGGPVGRVRVAPDNVNRPGNHAAVMLAAPSLATTALLAF